MPHQIECHRSPAREDCIADRRSCSIYLNIVAGLQYNLNVPRRIYIYIYISASVLEKPMLAKLVPMLRHTKRQRVSRSPGAKLVHLNASVSVPVFEHKCSMNVFIVSHIVLLYHMQCGVGTKTPKAYVRCPRRYPKPLSQQEAIRSTLALDER